MSCLPSYTLYYDIPLTIWPAAARGEHLPGIRDWRLPGRTLQNTGKENFYTHLLETLLTKRTMNRDVFAVKPVTLLLNLM